MFSVLVPTCNRPEKTLRAIRSVIEQGRSDIQIVVVDNSETGNLCNELPDAGDISLTYVRTGGLPPNENWVAGVPHCSQEHVLYLLDREVLPHGTLNRLAALLEQAPGLPIAWQEAMPIGMAIQPQQAIRVSAEQAREGLVQSLCGVNSGVEMRSHSICYPKNLFTAIQNKLDGDIINFMASDLAGPIQMTFLVDSFIYIPERIKQTSLSSSQTVKGMMLWKESLAEMNLAAEETYTHVPIKHYFILNHILNGVLCLCEKNALQISLEGDLLEAYFQYIYNCYMRAVQKYHIPAGDFMKAFFNASVAHGMNNTEWFNKIFYFWNWPEGYVND